MKYLIREKPKTWKELQTFVADVFRGCGFNVEEPKAIQTTREQVEVDVYAKDLSVPAGVFLCECKHWKTKVSKEKVHAFRTVVGDFGANAGFIISSMGFQKGAYDSIKNTNIQLVTWEGFQGKFLERWIETISNSLSQTRWHVYCYCDPLEDFVSQSLASKTEAEVDKYTTLVKNALPLCSGGASLKNPEQLFKTLQVRTRWDLAIKWKQELENLRQDFDNFFGSEYRPDS